MACKSQIAQLRSEINGLDQLKRQKLQSIEAANKFIQVLYSLQQRKMSISEFTQFVTVLKEEENSIKKLKEIQTLLLRHKDEFAAVDFMLGHLDVPVYGLDFKKEYAQLVLHFPQLCDGVTFYHQAMASNVLSGQPSTQLGSDAAIEGIFFEGAHGAKRTSNDPRNSSSSNSSQTLRNVTMQ